LLVVGVGASAGGLEACQLWLQHFPCRSHWCCVIAQHQPGDGDTALLVRQLQRVAGDWKVRIAQHLEELQGGCALVIPAGRHARVQAGRIHLQSPSPTDLSVPSVDVLLKSLAEDYGPKAIGVILSGAGSDGVAGCRAIQRLGGRTHAQSDPRFDGMPGAARAARVIDDSATLRSLAQQISGLPSELAVGDRTAEPGLADVLELVRCHTGHDFRQYKPETLWRRVEARMNRTGTSSLKAYLEQARRNPREVATLQNHFLVSLSSFFRDPECFAALTPHLKNALEGKDRFSVWTPGCATGEETYSLAILLDECRQGVKAWLEGADLNPEALEVARAGIYSLKSVQHLTRARLERYFEAKGQHLQVRERLRSMCTFRCLDVLSNSPPQDLDLISCRNFLIYLQSDLQASLLKRFHQALRPGGLLFLGPAERLGPSGGCLFGTLDAAHRIFQRRPA